MSEPMVLMLVIGAVLIAGGAVYNKLREDRRTKEFTEWAGVNGWAYRARDRGPVARFGGTPFTGRGTVRHALSGVHRDRPVQTFEYSYTRSSGTGTDRRTSTYTFHVTAVDLPAAVPGLEVTGEHLGHKLLSLVGMNDLQLGDAEFDDRFRVRADDERFARTLLDGDAMRWLLHDPRAPQRPFRLEAGAILTWTKGSLATDEALAQADFLVDVLRALPADVLDPTRNRRWEGGV